MRKLLLILPAIALTVNVIRAQVHIQTTIPTVGLIQKNQLWNIVLVNGTATAIEGRLELVLRDRQSGMELLTAATSYFSLPKGSLSVNINSLNPIQYNYLGMEPDKTMNGLLAAGPYLACFSFTRSASEKQEILSEECVAFDSEPLSPPMLMFPADSAELDVSPAQFTWTPPLPGAMFNHLQYEILITEIIPGQKAAEALQENMSLYSPAGIDNNFLTYPGSLPAFEKGKWYAWQVIASDDKNYAGKSEVWVFRVKAQVPLSPMAEMTPFVKMKTSNPEKSIAPDGFLKLAYTNETSDSTAIIELTDLTSSGARQKPISFSVPVKPGENLIQYDLRKMLGTPDETKVYQAVLRNSRGETWYMRFSVRYFEKKKS
jgi:hypothetical protein